MKSMEDRRGWRYLISLLSFPFLLLARTGLFGQQAHEESEVAVGDWASYGRIVLIVIAVVALGVMIGLAI